MGVEKEKSKTREESSQGSETQENEKVGKLSRSGVNLFLEEEEEESLVQLMILLLASSFLHFSPDQSGRERFAAAAASSPSSCPFQTQVKYRRKREGK